MRNLIALGWALFLIPVGSSAATPPHPGEIALGLRRLATVGSVLYVAAHPDDENTRLLSWLVGARGLRVGYLSLTRGDGGQNLVGAEQDELLGLLRTHELLAARRIDGASQLFTRARDFGYSKNAAETLAIWGREAVLADVVLAVRRFRPDIVVARFGTQPPNHGHHIASALLAAEAFTAAADPARFPEQIAAGFAPWQADRLLQNVSTWNLPKDADLSGYLRVDVGGYEPWIGRSWGERAADARSQHRSQGFGVAPERGPFLEYFAPVAGTQPKADPFEGLDFTWRRLAGAGAVGQALAEIERAFDPRFPHRSVAALVKAHEALGALAIDGHWKSLKLLEIEGLVAACSGLLLEARAADPGAPAGATVSVKTLALNRSPVPMKLLHVVLPGDQKVAVGADLKENQPLVQDTPMALPAGVAPTVPYWLARPSTRALYDTPDLSVAGLPEGEPLTVAFAFEAAGRRFSTRRPVVHAWTDPVRGELYRPFEVTPEVTATFANDVFTFPNGRLREVSVTVGAGRADVSGALRIEVPAGWKCDPPQRAFKLATLGDAVVLRFKVIPPRGTQVGGRLRAVVDLGGREVSWSARTVEHEHVPPLTWRAPAEAAAVAFPLETRVWRLGYVPGPGDKVAEMLDGAGFQVTLLPEERLEGERLERYDAILVGVRAFNANPRLAAHRDRLLAYVEGGGRLIVQYNTNSRIGPLTVPIGPYPIDIGRDRVTDETAEMRPVKADDPLLRSPNRLSPADYEGWVQERGLYFASKWDDQYRPVFEMNDPGEAPLRGSLLVTRHGKGVFVYTGLSFFRQLPAGVPGAFRLLTNLINAGR